MCNIWFEIEHLKKPKPKNRRKKNKKINKRDFSFEKSRLFNKNKTTLKKIKNKGKITPKSKKEHRATPQINEKTEKGK